MAAIVAILARVAAAAVTIAVTAAIAAARAAVRGRRVVIVLALFAGIFRGASFGLLFLATKSLLFLLPLRLFLLFPAPALVVFTSRRLPIARSRLLFGAEVRENEPLLLFGQARQEGALAIIYWMQKYQGT